MLGFRAKPCAVLHWPRIVAVGILLITLTVTYAGITGPPCIWRMLTHVPCPGCGLTRSIRALWHGDIVLSFRYHPLGLPLVLGCISMTLPWPDALKQRMPRNLIVYSGIGVLFLFIGIWLTRLLLASSGNTFFEW